MKEPTLRRMLGFLYELDDRLDGFPLCRRVVRRASAWVLDWLDDVRRRG